MMKKAKRIRCKSGLIGWQAHLRDNYNNLEDFRVWSEMYGVHSRLGYATADDAWEDNPLIQGSTIPSDLCKIVNGKRVEVPQLEDA